MKKPMEEWTFDELVDETAADILKALLAGQFQTSVYLALDRAVRWAAHKDKKCKKSKSKRA